MGLTGELKQRWQRPIAVSIVRGVAEGNTDARVGVGVGVYPRSPTAEDSRLGFVRVY